MIQRIGLSMGVAALLALMAGTMANAAGHEDGWSVKWKNGTEIKSNDGQFALKIGGRIQTDFAYIDPDPELEVSSGDNGGTGVEFRRARLFVSGTLYDKILFKAQYDFAGDVDDVQGVEGSNFKDVYVGLKKPVTGVSALKIGHFKEPFSLEQLISDKYITFLERSVADVFAPGRNTGIALNGTLAGERMTWAAGGFANANDKGTSTIGSGAYNLTGRVTGLPLYADKGRQLVHLGLSYSHQFRGDATVEYSQRPEQHLAEMYVSARHPEVDCVDLVGAEAAAVLGPFSVQAEYMRSNVHGASGLPDADFWGAYVYGSWFITGESRAYKRSSGTFSRTKPNRNFDPGQGDWGAFELALRFSKIDLTDGTIEGGEMRDLTAGINWYLFPNLRFMLDYINSDVNNKDPSKDHGTANIATARMSFDF